MGAAEALAARHARVDDRRVISGIVHVLRSGCRWKDTPRERYGACQDPLQPSHPLERQGVWRTVLETLAAAGGPPAEGLIDSTHIKTHRSATGGRGAAQAIGSSRVGRNTKLHALADRCRSPLTFVLTLGQAADCRVAETLLTGLALLCIVLADRAAACARPSEARPGGHQPGAPVH